MQNKSSLANNFKRGFCVAKMRLEIVYANHPKNNRHGTLGNGYIPS